MSGLPIQKLPHEYTEGDELPELTGTLANTDITNHTVVLRMDRPGTSNLELAGIITDGPTGAFKFAFGPTDLVAGLEQPTTVEFLDSSGKPQTTKRFLIDVTKRIPLTDP